VLPSAYSCCVLLSALRLTHAQLLLAKVRPHAIPVDRHGLVVGAGLQAAPKARAAFVTPSHQFPTGVALSMARRLELLAWARTTGAFIIEDDYTSEFRYSGPPLASLQGLDQDESVVYVGTLNKALFPGLRMGYAVVPPALLPAFTTARYLLDRQPPSLCQAVLVEFMQQGHFGADLRRIRQMYREQRDAPRLRSAPDRRAGPGDASCCLSQARSGRRHRGRSHTSQNLSCGQSAAFTARHLPATG
jgi:GntR family transcriptional regulator/MocR family aminotransferase